jgi:TRAP-type C4-dicarboxylate transport system substrate-binding protein
MKKMFYVFLVFTLFACIGNPPTTQGQEVIKLKLVHSFPVTHVANLSLLRFIEEAEKLSNHKVKIENYPAEQLGKLKDFLNLCSQGIADIAYVAPAFYAGHLPLNTVMILPFFTTAVEGTEIYNRLLDTCPELNQEFLKYGARPLLLTSSNQYDIGTVKKPVRSPEDLKGLKLKTSGGTYDKIAKQYGINGVTIPSPEIYEATQRGVVEGNILSYPSVKGYRLNELEKYHTFGGRMGGFPWPYLVNEKKWQTLPGEIQKSLLAAAKNYNKYHSESWDRDSLKLLEEFEKGGMTIYRITEKDRAQWDAPLKGIEEVWIQDMEKKGLPGKKIFLEYKKICQEVAK